MDDRSGFLENVLRLLDESGIGYCAIGGVAVNAYAAPVFTEGLDLVVASDEVDHVKDLMASHYKTREFAHSFNVYDPDSRLQVQFQLGDRFAGFVERSAVRDVVGLAIPVAAPEDLLQAKVAAALEPTRRLSKHFKDLSDIVRLIEVFPELEVELPLEAKRMIERRG